MFIYENPDLAVPIESTSGEILLVSYSPKLGTWIEPHYRYQEASRVALFEEKILCRVPPYAKVRAVSEHHIVAAVAFPLYRQYRGSGSKTYGIDTTPLFNVKLRLTKQKRKQAYVLSVECKEDGSYETLVETKDGCKVIFSEKELDKDTIHAILGGAEIPNVSVVAV